MKRSLSAFSIILLLLSFVVCFASCSDSNAETTPADSNTETTPAIQTSETTSKQEQPSVDTEYDIWDGVSAYGFGSGDGSFSKPYLIRNCAGLAYLAKQVQNGFRYEGKHFRLEADLNLNNKAWTPIGTSATPFMGIFDGNDHTISNVKITSPVYDNSNAYAGLFGCCKNAMFSNLKIKNVSIKFSPSKRCNFLFVGGLIGYGVSSDYFGIENVKLSDVTITVSQKYHDSDLRAGGCAGSIVVGKNSYFEGNGIQVFAEIASIENSSSNYLGSVVGRIESQNSVSLNNIASYCSFECGFGLNYSGTVGGIVSSSSVVSMSNVFSKLSLERDMVHNDSRAGVAVGVFLRLTGSGISDNPSSYKLRNVFGSSVQTGGNQFQIVWGDPQNLTQTNCEVCTILPQSNGFSRGIWDLSSMSQPVLK